MNDLPVGDCASHRLREDEGVEGEQELVVLGELVEEESEWG